MRILITNDDGIQASQLLPLVKWAQKLGQVTVAAPKVEQSGKSHGIEIHKAFEVKPFPLLEGVTAWAVDSTPADCVRFAVLGMFGEFDLVISGINRGLNVGADMLYSGTVSAIFEAAALGIPAIAFSTPPEYYEQAAGHLDDIWQYVMDRKLMDVCGIYNINIPANPREIRITRQGGPYYSDDFAPQENHMYLPVGKPVHVTQHNYELDTDAVLTGGYISVTPLTMDRTNKAVFEMLK